MKRYILIQVEYESEQTDRPRHYLSGVMNNLKRLIQEDMPYLQLTFISDSPVKYGIKYDTK